MKKLLSFLLVLTMLLGMLTACPKPQCDVHTDENLDNVCDVCEAKLTNDLTKLLGLKILKAAKDQVDSAKSVKVVFDMQVGMKYEEGSELLQHNDGVITYTVWLNRTESGIDYKVHSLEKYRDLTTGSDYTVELDAITHYMIDGVSYVYNSEEDAYEKFDTNGMPDDTPADVTQQLERVEAVLVDLINDYTMSEEDLGEMGAALVTSFNIVNGKGGVTVDLKPYLDSFKTYIQSLDPETKTLRSLLNDILALSDPTLTVEKILATVGEVGAMTVGEVLDAVDAYLVQEQGKTMQQLYEELLADERVLELLKAALLPTEATPQDREEFDAWLAELKQMKLADEIPNEIKVMTVYDLFLTMMADGEDEGDRLPLGYMIDQINAILNLSLADAEELFELPITDSLQQVKALVDDITVNALQSKVEMDFDNVYQLKTLTVSVLVDIRTSFPIFGGEIYAGGDSITTLTMSMSCSVSDIADTPVSITAPTNLIAA